VDIDDILGSGSIRDLGIIYLSDLFNREIRTGRERSIHVKNK
jgi:hypothetical protein